MIGHQPRGDAVKAAAAAARPDLGAQEAQRHLDETVIEMREHDVIAVACDRVVEGDRSDVAGVRMPESLRAESP